MSGMVDRRLSTLDPNAPVFDPVGFREVEDFSPKWWDLITTSKWFRDFWLTTNSEYDFEDGDDFSVMEEEFEEMIASSDSRSTFDKATESDVAKYLKMLLNMAESTKEKMYRSNVTIASCSQRYNQKKKKNYVSPNFTCRRNHHIYQPR